METTLTRRAAILGLSASVSPLLLPLSACATPKQSCPPQAPLAVYGARPVMELAPIHLALRKLYSADAAVRQGGVGALVGPNPTADVAANGETQQLLHSLNGPDMRIVMTVAEGHYFIAARRAPGIAKLDDLKGKRIATIKKTTAGYFLHKMLGTVGLGFSDVSLVETAYGKAGAAFITGESDALAMWDPEAEMAMRAVRARGEDLIVFPGEGVYYERYNLCTTAAALADPCKRREIVALMRAIIVATRAMNDNPAVAAEAQALVAQVGPGAYPLEDIVASWPHTKYVASLDDTLLDLFVDQDAWLAAQDNRPPRSRDQLARLIDSSAYAEAVAS